MKKNKWKILFSLACISTCMGLFCPDSFAAEAMTEGRRQYNTIMLWVNFSILAIVFIKFGKKPLIEFLRGARETIESNLNEIKKRHSDRKTVLEAEEAKLNDIQKSLDAIRERIIEMGENEKRKIIANAKVSAEKMIQDAKAYARFQLEKARKQMSDEMVDIAISMVEKRLKKGISQADEDRLVGDFLVNINAVKPRLN